MGRAGREPRGSGPWEVLEQRRAGSERMESEVLSKRHPQHMSATWRRGDPDLASVVPARLLHRPLPWHGFSWQGVLAGGGMVGGRDLTL